MATHKKGKKVAAIVAIIAILALMAGVMFPFFAILFE
jgi:hypothetical protein